MSQAMVSVLIPTYNTEEFVESAISSILQQTYKNLEIVIVDDASTDKTFDIVSQLQQKDKRIKLYRNERNLGVGHSANKGLDHCNGEYIARMDSDDIAVNTRIALQVEFMEANRDIAGCGTWGRSFGDKGGLIKYPTEDRQIRDYFPFDQPFLHPSFLMRDSFMKEHSLRYDFRFAAEDYELADRILQCGKLANIPKVLLFHQVREVQVTKQNINIVQSSASTVRRRYTNRFFL